MASVVTNKTLTFTGQLMHQLETEWRRNHQHPFVLGMADGTLDPVKFRFYMVQDYLYLIDYAKLFALGAVKASRLEHMQLFAGLLHSTLNEEMGLHRAYAKRFGISETELEQAQPSPVMLAYTHYMLHCANNGTLAHLMAALLPCMWSYWEIGKALAAIPGALNHPLYGDWIAMYSSEGFGELAQTCIGLMDELAADVSESERQKLADIFLNTTRFEYLFWDMADKQQMW